MNNIFKSFTAICRMIKIEHSIFALPYAWSGLFLAVKGLPPLVPTIFLTIAMIAIRSFAMTFNRIADLQYDRQNPRTAGRPLVTGEISIKQAWIFNLCCCIIFIGSCYFLNRLCLWLSLPTIIFVAIYSYLKRYTSLCHYWLGASLGLAPLAGWLAINPSYLGLPPLMLFFAVTFWVGAFDIYYAFQDLDIDIKTGLHSLPADLGTQSALAIAAFSHIITIIFLLLCGLTANLSWPWYVICLGIGCLLFWEHKLVNPQDLRNINMAFFTLNGIISPVVLIGIILGIYL